MYINSNIKFIIFLIDCAYPNNRMDRSWMSKDRRSKDYEEGVEYFINFALQL